jgi:hypothetical protein
MTKKLSINIGTPCCLIMILLLAMLFTSFHIGANHQKVLQTNKHNTVNAPSLSNLSQIPTLPYQTVYVELGIPIPDLQSIVEETTTWKNYRGSYFSFKYPSNWKVKNLLERNRNLAWLKNTVAFVGIGPATLTYDDFAQIRVATDSPEVITQIDSTVLIRKYKDRYYVLNGDFENNHILNLIYSTFRFAN